eukprot:TRINITY_DN141_c0_g1_i2.p1 TRINITY_DN141_c0_g1~~TRINITY_DN141_c0_g1_i2.p1  ORF type:complete len:253 (+),score=82.21 TRINITY_DN141_c0_g1_i2:102-860(+)
MNFLRKAAELMGQNYVAPTEAETSVKVAPAPVFTPVFTPVVTPVVAKETVVVQPALETIEMKAAQVDLLEKPAVIKETVIPEQQEIIQPVIHREIEKTEIRHIIQPIYQEETLPVQIHDRELPAEFRGELRVGPSIAEKLAADNQGIAPQIITTTVAPTVTTIVNKPIIHEIIRPHIIEEIQPVIHRTIHEPHVVHERKDIYEKIVEAPVEVTETRAAIYEKAPSNGPAMTKVILEPVVPVVVVPVVAREAM